MSDIDPDVPSPAGSIRIAHRKLGPAGVQLGLKAGDVLVAVNGKPFEGDGASLQLRFDQAHGKPLALTFVRGKVDITVLAYHPNLGLWEACDKVSDWTGERQDPESMLNWEALRSVDGLYDLHPMTPNLSALLCPPLWLMQNRLWVHAVAISAVLFIMWLIWWPLGPVSYVLAGMVLRQTGPILIRLDRINRGLIPYAMVAAHNEAAAHAAYGKIDPVGRFLFSSEPAEASSEVEEDQTAPETTA